MSKKPAKRAAKRRAKTPSAKAAPKVPTAPSSSAPANAPPTPTTTRAKTPDSRDPRLPAAGTSTVRTFKGKDHRVTYLEHGVEVDGTTFDSLSAAARHVTGAASINGFLFFGLTEPKPPRTGAKTPITTPPKDAKAKHPDEPKIGHGNEIGTPAGQRAALTAVGIAKRGRPITKPRDATASTKGATK